MNASIAGLLSGLSFVVNSPSQWQFFILYIFSRGLDIGKTLLQKKGRLPEIPIGECLLMSMMWPVMAYIYSVEPDALNRSVRQFYYNFSKQSSNDQTIKWIWKCQMSRDLMRNPRHV